MSIPAIETAGLGKRYGDIAGIADLDLRVERGEVFGFLGPNGAGKTTTIRMLVDLIRPTAGSAHVCGYDTPGESLAVRRRVGYLPGDLRLPPKRTPRELLTHLSHLRGAEAGEQIEERSPPVSASSSTGRWRTCRRETARRWAWWPP